MVPSVLAGNMLRQLREAGRQLPKASRPLGQDGCWGGQEATWEEAAVVSTIQVILKSEYADNCKVPAME